MKLILTTICVALFSLSTFAQVEPPYKAKWKGQLDGWKSVVVEGTNNWAAREKGKAIEISGKKKKHEVYFLSPEFDFSTKKEANLKFMYAFGNDNNNQNGGNLSVYYTENYKKSPNDTKWIELATDLLSEDVRDWGNYKTKKILIKSSSKKVRIAFKYTSPDKFVSKRTRIKELTLE